MKIKNIPLSQLVPSPANVRKTGSLNGIKELADSIAAHGLLQNLQVRKAASGKFEVVAGGRRHAALKLLAKKKALAKGAPIACNVLAACRGALEERTRDRVPLDWAMTQMNLGITLQNLGERESGTARLEEAVTAYNGASELFVASHFDFYETTCCSNRERTLALIEDRRK